MNITGLRHRVRGSSLRSASGRDRQQLLRVEQARRRPGRRVRRCRRRRSPCGASLVVDGHVIVPRCVSHRPSASGPSARAGRKVSATRIDGDADDHADEQRLVGGQGARRGRVRAVCRASEPARPSTKMIGRNRPSSMHSPSAVSHHGGVDGDAGERGAVVVARRGERVEHLGEAVRAGVQRRRVVAGGERGRGADQHQRRGDQEVQRGELDLPGADLLAQVLRRAARPSARPRTP